MALAGQAFISRFHCKVSAIPPNRHGKERNFAMKMEPTETFRTTLADNGAAEVVKLIESRRKLKKDYNEASKRYYEAHWNTDPLVSFLSSRMRKALDRYLLACKTFEAEFISARGRRMHRVCRVR
jgi:hypothetical protein